MLTPLRPPPSLRRARPGLALAAMALLAATQAEAAPLTWDIEASGYTGGLHVGEATGSIELDGDAYRLRFTAEGAGLVRLLLSWGYELEVEGKAGPTTPLGIAPSSYSSTRFRRGKTSVRTIRFENGVAESETRGDDGKAPAPLPVKDRSGVVDPASAVLAIAFRLAREKTCDITFPVFDGKRRNDFVITDMGTDTLAPSRQNPVGGPARRCSFVSKRIAGYSDEAMRRAPFTGDIWFQEGDDGHLRLPLKFRSNFRFGAFILHIRPKQGGGPERARPAGLRPADAPPRTAS